jgi:pimeloyl-ACP methyl ester carboxylesterase
MALWLLLYRAASVRRLALVAPGGLGSEVSPLLRLAATFGGLEAGAELLMGPIMRLLVRLCGQELSSEDQEAICRLNRCPGTARAFVRTLRDVIDWRGQRRHLMQRIHEVSQLPSIALFWGEDDWVIPLQHGRDLCALFDNCSFWQLPGAGHFLHWEAPRELAAALLEYLDAPALERAGWGRHRAVVSSASEDTARSCIACRSPSAERA